MGIKKGPEQKARRTERRTRVPKTQQPEKVVLTEFQFTEMITEMIQGLQAQQSQLEEMLQRMQEHQDNGYRV